MATPIPPNRARFTTSSIALATGGRLARGDGRAEARGVTTDSRAVVTGGAFVALRGERSDGHGFVEAAARAGASIIVVERGRSGAVGDVNVDVVEVDDTLRAWGDLARAHLEEWRAARSASDPARVVAITGSAGKTTTRELCAAILSAVGPCLASTGNLNNRIGLPAIALSVDAEHRFLVLEAGMSLRGEIAELARIASPDVAVVTNVGMAHAEGVGGGRPEIAREKGALYAVLGASGVAIVNADDDEVTAQRARTSARAETFGRSAAARYRLVDRVSLGARGSRVAVDRAGERLDLELSLIGEAAAIDLVAAIAASDAANTAPVDSVTIAKALERLASVAGRGTLRRLLDDTIVIDDSYNANPASVRNALRSLAEVGRAESRRTVAVLGEMKELGASAAHEHEAIGDDIAEAAVAVAVGCGGLIDLALDRAASRGVAVVKAASTDDAASRACDVVRARDVVLVKGSRSVGAERVVEALVRARGGLAEAHGDR